MTLVTISASYGAGGSRVAPRVAQRLGVAFLGRPAERQLVDGGQDPDPDGEARAGDERIGAGAGGLLSRIASIAVSWGTPPGLSAEELLPDHARRGQLEAEVQAFAAAGEGVVLGRGALVVLRDDPRALHVLLDGPVEARIRQAMEIEGIERSTAERRQNRVDRLRRAYLEQLYGVDVHQPGVFQLVLDSTAIPLAGCVDIITLAARTGRNR
jgi:hypothetical protein